MSDEQPLKLSATEFHLKGTAAEIAKWRLKDFVVEEIMVTFDNAYQMRGLYVANVNMYVANVNIVICEM